MVSAMDVLMEKVEALMESVSNVHVTEKQLVDYGLAGYRSFPVILNYSAFSTQNSDFI